MKLKKKKVIQFGCSEKTQIGHTLHQTSGYLSPCLPKLFPNIAKLKVKFRVGAFSSEVISMPSGNNYSRYLQNKNKQTKKPVWSLTLWTDCVKTFIKPLVIKAGDKNQMNLYNVFTEFHKLSDRETRQVSSSPLPLASLSTYAFNILTHNY